MSPTVADLRFNLQNINISMQITFDMVAAAGCGYPYGRYELQCFVTRSLHKFSQWVLTTHKVISATSTLGV